MMLRPSAFRRVLAALTSVAMLTALVAIAPSSALASGSGGITERESVASGNPGAQASGASTYPAISQDSGARYVAFASDASNLVSGDSNNATDVFVRDRLTGTTQRVSVDSAGHQGANGVSSGGLFGPPSISADGNLVAFESNAQLSSTPTSYTCIYVHNRTTGQTQLVSIGLGNTAPNADSYQPSISADGNFVAFASSASNLVSPDTNNSSDVFVRNLTTGVTTRVSVGGASGAVSSAEYPSDSRHPSISGDGRYVAFEKQLDTSNPNLYWEIWVRDTQAGTTTRLSVPVLSNDTVNSNSYNPAISEDGSYVAFDTFATNLKGLLGDGQRSVIRANVGGTAFNEVSAATGNPGAEGNGPSDTPAISSDGRFVAFRSDATNLTSGDTNGHTDIFLRDCTNYTTTLESQSTAGTQGNADSAIMPPAISADGSLVVFASDASNLVLNDNNSATDIFGRLTDTTAPVTTLQPTPAPNAYGWWNTNVSVALTATDTGSGVASTSYTLNGGAPQAYSTPFNVTTEGTTNVGYYSTDNAGNVEVAKSTAIKIDKTLPTLTLSASSNTTHSAPFAVTATPGDGLSGVDTTQGVQMQVDGGAWAKTSSVNLAVGTHTINAKVFDNAGNEKDASITGVQVNASSPDTTPPVTAVESTPASGAWVNQATAPKMLVSTDDESGVTTLHYGLANPPTSTLTTAAELAVYWTLPSVAWLPGTNTLYYYSTDASNNVETMRSLQVKYDNTAPQVSLDAANNGVFYTGTLTVHATAKDDAGASGVKSCDMRLDSGSWQPGYGIVVPLGTHTVDARATDNAGNTSDVSSIHVTVNPAPIAVSLATPKVSGSATHKKPTLIVGSVSPAHAASVIITIQKSVKKKWKSYKTVHATAGPTGSWSFKLKMPKASYRMRSTTVGGTTWGAGLSGWRSFKVK